MISSPCLNCPDRHQQCHGTCEKYAEFRHQKELEYNKRREEASYSGYLSEQTDMARSNKKGSRKMPWQK